MAENDEENMSGNIYINKYKTINGMNVQFVGGIVIRKL